MKTLTRFLVGALFFVSIDAQAGEWTINYCKDLTVDEFHEAAKWAFQKRKYVIVGETANGLSSSYYYVLPLQSHRSAEGKKGRNRHDDSQAYRDPVGAWIRVSQR